jgi:tRNA threonylcarbamoyl adenosine modification protein YeaZ
MTILALEFSTEQRSVALRHAGGVAGASCASRAVGGLTLVEQCLQRAGLGPEAVTCVAVGLGPGSYTGVRSAIALAQGWQLARAVNVLGVSTVECLAWQAHQAGWRGRVTFALDAQRDEFYLAGYELDNASPHVVEPLRLAGQEELQQRARGGELLAGPEIHRWFPAGRLLVPEAAMLAALAARRNDFVPAEQLEPVYLRAVNFVKAPPPRRW